MREFVDAPSQKICSFLGTNVDQDALGDEDGGTAVIDVALRELLLEGCDVGEICPHHVIVFPVEVSATQAHVDPILVLRHNLVEEHAGLLDKLALARGHSGEVHFDEVAHHVTG